MNPRKVAFKVLEKISFSARHLQTTLDEELNRRLGAEERDKAFTTNLLYTVLRQRLMLEFILQQVSNYHKLEKKLQLLLLLAAAEMVFLRTPDYAAVNAWVEISKTSGLKRTSGLVNGILRSLGRLQAWPLLDDSDETGFLSTSYSHPRWLVRAWLDQFGPAATRQWLQASQQEPLNAIRVNTLKISVSDMHARLQETGLLVQGHPLSRSSLVLENGVIFGFAEGLWQKQDPGAIAISELLGVRPGSRVLDMCAGVGGKSGHLAQLMENQGELLAIEISEGRARAWQKNMLRLGVTCARLWQADAASLSAHEVGLFDYILLDAPCSGLGTTGRRPDIRWRRTEDDLSAMVPLQRKLLQKAIDLLQPGGILLYATCTTARRENNGNIEWLLNRHPEIAPTWLCGAHLHEGFWQTFPEPLQCDGFFAARLQKAA